MIKLKTFYVFSRLVFKALFALQYVHHMHIGSKIATSIDQNEITAGVFLGLSKAFDTLDHQTLFRKLEHDGVCGLALQWIKSYFSIAPNSSRSPLNDTHSSEQIIGCGVPQGSILGPLFCILYINDLPKTTRLADTLQMILVSFTPIFEAARAGVTQRGRERCVTPARAAANYDTRTAAHFQPHTCRTDIKQFTMLFRGPKIWNALLLSVTSSPSLTTFKKKAS